MAGNNPVTLEDALRGIEERHPGAVRPTAAGLALRLPRLATGWLALDHALAGGAAVGRVILVAGRKGSFKTTMALKVVAAFQRRCVRCWRWLRLDPPAHARARGWLREQPWWELLRELDEAAQLAQAMPLLEATVCGCPVPRPGVAVWIDYEGVWFPAWSEAMGVDLHASRLKLVEPEYAEQGIDIAEALLAVDDVCLLVIDSVANLMPQEEIEKSSINDQQALLARLVSKLVHKLVSKRNEAVQRDAPAKTVVLINQLRTKMGVRFPVEIEPGGYAQLFAASVVLRMKPAYPSHEWDGLAANKTPPAGRPPDRAVATFEVLASKVSPPKVNGMVSMWLHAAETPLGKLPGAPVVTRQVGDPEDVEQTLAWGLKHRVVRRERHKLVLPDRTRHADEQAVCHYWLTDPLAFMLAKEAIIAAAYEGAIV